MSSLPEGIRQYACADGWEILVGGTARVNDQLSIKIAKPYDFWFHVAGVPGSHVLARHPDRPSQLPREIKRIAAGLAVHFSKAKNAGRCAVHWTTAGYVSKPRGAAPGKVALQRYQSMNSGPLDPASLANQAPTST